MAGNRSALSQIHDAVTAHLLARGGGVNLYIAHRHSCKIKAATVARLCVRGQGRGLMGRFTVQINPQTAGINKEVPLFVWEGVAEDAWEARAKAWQAWMDGDEYLPPRR